MKTKKVSRTRCECDHCGKKNWSPPHMKTHEEHCTMRPDRVCGVCSELLQEEQTPIGELMALLPDPSGRWVQNGDIRSLPAEFEAEVEAAIQALRDAANSCPICMLSAIRQRGIPAPIAASLDVKKEMASIWKEQNVFDEY